MARLSVIVSILAALALCACADESLVEDRSFVNGVDPLIARALNDPLMVDPDLAYRNEANAAITVGHDHALPSFMGSAETASAARDVARLGLLEDGPIPDLPPPAKTAGPADLSDRYGVEAVLEALDVPSDCRGPIKGGFVHAADLPDAARVMPHGMVRVAAAVESPQCYLRLVRYVSPVPIEDALQFHYTLADRAGFEMTRFVLPEESLAADRRGTFLRIFARQASGELTAVDVITWER